MKRYLLSAILLIFCLHLGAQTIPDVPNPPRLVNDFVGLLSVSEQNTLEESLVQFNNQTSTQIVVAIVSTLDGTEVSDFAFKMGEKWGIGQKGKNNGILVLIKPKIGNERGQAFIAVGYGLEGVVPDAIARRIVQNDMISRFKQNDYFGGISAGVDVLMKLTKGEFTADQYEQQNAQKSWLAFIPFAVIGLIIVLIAVFGGGSGGNNHTIGGNSSFWIAMAALAASRNSGRGSYGGFSSGSGSFGGFGGGSFGGGGAGGSW